MKLLKQIKFRFRKEKCFHDMQNAGIANGKCCHGIAGEDKNTNWIQESCIDCPYYNNTY